MKVSLSCNGFLVTDAVVQIQKDAPTKLLIGTEFLPRLGFIFLQTGAEGDDVDLL